MRYSRISQAKTVGYRNSISHLSKISTFCSKIQWVLIFYLCQESNSFRQERRHLYSGYKIRRGKVLNLWLSSSSWFCWDCRTTSCRISSSQTSPVPNQFLHTVLKCVKVRQIDSSRIFREFLKFLTCRSSVHLLWILTDSTCDDETLRHCPVKIVRQFGNVAEFRKNIDNPAQALLCLWHDSASTVICSVTSYFYFLVLEFQEILIHDKCLFDFAKPSLMYWTVDCSCLCVKLIRPISLYAAVV